MSTRSFETPTAGRIRGSARRVWSMSRAELRLMGRNKAVMFTALAMPLLMMFFVFSVDVGREALGASMATALIGFALLFLVYHNLVSAFVARREELALKRLRTSVASDAEILLGVAVPALLFTVAWAVLSVAGAAALLDLGVPVNPVLLVVGLVGGAAVLVLLAATTAAVTKTAEMAQVTTLPMVLVCIVGSGLMVPLDLLPGVVGDVARLIPLTPAMELVRLGLDGTTGAAEPVGFAASFREAAAPAALTVVWICLGVYATRRWFRWEPRP